jgi:hypothetical protein
MFQFKCCFLVPALTTDDADCMQKQWHVVETNPEQDTAYYSNKEDGMAEVG